MVAHRFLISVLGLCLLYYVYGHDPATCKSLRPDFSCVCEILSDCRDVPFQDDATVKRDLAPEEYEIRRTATRGRGQRSNDFCQRRCKNLLAAFMRFDLATDGTFSTANQVGANQMCSLVDRSYIPPTETCEFYLRSGPFCGSKDVYAIGNTGCLWVNLAPSNQNVSLALFADGTLTSTPFGDLSVMAPAAVGITPLHATGPTC